MIIYKYIFYRKYNNKINSTNVDELVEEIIKEEPIINNSKKDALKGLIYKLIEKIVSKKE